jgi:hypothetical protein
MATWFEITYTGDPTEADYARVAELAGQGFTSGQLLNDPEEDDDEDAVRRDLEAGAWFGHHDRRAGTPPGR